MSASPTQCIKAHRLTILILAREPMGCCFHCLLADFNVEDELIRNVMDNLTAYCVSWHCCRLGKILLVMTKTQRLKLAHGGYAQLSVNNP